MARSTLVSQSIVQVFVATATVTAQTTSPAAAASSSSQLNLLLCPGVWALALWTYPVHASTLTMVPVNIITVTKTETACIHSNTAMHNGNYSGVQLDDKIDILVFISMIIVVWIIRQHRFLLVVCMLACDTVKKNPHKICLQIKMSFFLEIFADEKCSVLISATAISAKCHVHLPLDQYYTVSTHYEQTATLCKLIWLINIKVKIVFAGRPVFKEPVIVATMCRGACALH